MHYFVYMERLINDFNEDCLLLSLIKPHAYGNTEKHVIDLCRERGGIYPSLLYFKAEGDGTRIQMKDSQITIPISLERIETSLGEIFLRINESCIVNKGYVEAFNKKTLIIGAEELPVSKSHVKELYSSFHIL